MKGRKIASLRDIPHINLLPPWWAYALAAPPLLLALLFAPGVAYLGLLLLPAWAIWNKARWGRWFV